MRVCRNGMLTAVLVLLCAAAGAQCRWDQRGARNQGKRDPSQDTAIGSAEPLLPESGLLSAHSYTSLYFGFRLELPIAVSGHRMILAPMPEGEHALLAVGFQEGKRSGTLTITAGGRIDDEPKRQEDSPQVASDDAARPPRPGEPIGSAVRRLPPQLSQGSVHLRHVEKRQGEVRGAQYWGQIKNYTVRFTIETNDPGFLAKAKQAIADTHFYCAEEDGTLVADGKVVDPEGAPYQGPTIPTSRVEEAIRTRPAQQIPGGDVGFGTYRSLPLDLKYDLPQGWQSIGAEPERESEATPAAERIRYLKVACIRTLFRAAPSQFVAAGNRVPAILVLRALDQACLSVPFPASASDRLSAETLGEYLQMMGDFGEIKLSEVVTLSGRSFAVFHGLIGLSVRGQELAQRAPEVIVITRYRKLLLAWSWIAATEGELRKIDATRVTFGEETPIEIGPGIAPNP